jgi:hypothetical protein
LLKISEYGFRAYESSFLQLRTGKYLLIEAPRRVRGSGRASLDKLLRHSPQRFLVWISLGPVWVVAILGPTIQTIP